MMKSPLTKAEAAVKDKDAAKKMAEKIVEKKAAAKAAVAPKPVVKKEESRPVLSKNEEDKFRSELEATLLLEHKVLTREEAEATDYIEKRKEAVLPSRSLELVKPDKPTEDQLCLVRRRGNITLARYRHGDFYASHAGFYSELVDRPDAWTAVPEF